MPKYCGNVGYKPGVPGAQVTELFAATRSFAQTMYAIVHSPQTFTQVIRLSCNLVFTQAMTSVKHGLSAVSTPPIITTTLSDNLNLLNS